jgi:hypothetical protein
VSKINAKAGDSLALDDVIMEFGEEWLKENHSEL